MNNKLISIISLAALATSLSFNAMANAATDPFNCKIKVVATSAVAAKGGVIVNAESESGSQVYGSDVVLDHISTIEVPCYTYYRISATPLMGDKKNYLTYGKYNYRNPRVELWQDNTSITIAYPADFPDAPQ